MSHLRGAESHVPERTGRFGLARNGLRRRRRYSNMHSGRAHMNTRASRTRAAISNIGSRTKCGVRAGALERGIVGPHVLGRERVVVRSALRLQSHHLAEIRSAIRRLMGIGII